jgi:hypothetical protein
MLALVTSFWKEAFCLVKKPIRYELLPQPSRGIKMSGSFPSFSATPSWPAILYPSSTRRLLSKLLTRSISK